MAELMLVDRGVLVRERGFSKFYSFDKYGIEVSGFRKVKEGEDEHWVVFGKGGFCVIEVYRPLGGVGGFRLDVSCYKTSFSVENVLFYEPLVVYGEGFLWVFGKEFEVGEFLFSFLDKKAILFIFSKKSVLFVNNNCYFFDMERWAFLKPIKVYREGNVIVIKGDRGITVKIGLEGEKEGFFMFSQDKKSSFKFFKK